MDSGASRRLAVCGWGQDAPALLRAFEARAGLRPIAVADRSTHALVRARRETGLPCSRHPLEMLRVAPVEAVLVLSADDLPALTEIASERGIETFVAADRAPGAPLAAALAAAEATTRFALLRPRLRSAGLDFLADLAGAQPDWRPSYLEVTLEDDGPVETLLRDAVALAARLTHDHPEHVIASAAEPEGEPVAMAAEFRYASGTLTAVRVRFGPEFRAGLFAVTPRGRIELSTSRGDSRLLLGAAQADESASRLRDGNLFEREVERVTMGAGQRLDGLLGPGEAATLRALEFALGTGYVAPVEPLDRRGGLRLLRGGSAAVPGRGHLHLVGS